MRSRSRPLAVALLAAALAACSAGSDGDGGGGTAKFIVIGDTGTGPEGGQGDVAVVMEQVCALQGCDFAVVAGDNIYEMGVTSPLDPLFEIAFEQPYANLNFPFFMALGNHDNSYTLTGEGGINQKGDFEVMYPDVNPFATGKWTMPDRYYAATWPQDSANPVLELVVLDSSPISHFFDDPDPRWSGTAGEDYVAQQRAFVQDAFGASRARWKFAVAHHPYISNGDHGNAGQFDVGASQDPCSIAGPLASPTCRGEQYKAFLEHTVCGRADVFFTGHDHNLYWLQPTPACGNTQFILSGAGAKSRATLDPNRNPVFFQADNVYGFVHVTVDGDRFTGAVYVVNTDGTPANVDGAGHPVPAFVKTFTRN